MPDANIITSHTWIIYIKFLPVENVILDWNILLFSIGYHDIVYNVLKNGNEEKSAAKATSSLEQLIYLLIKLKVAAYKF